MNKIFVALILVLVFGRSYGRQDSPFFRTLTIRDGLSHNKVNAILQDHRGFLWFGTEDGLNRYDGLYFSLFRKQVSDSIGLSGNIITDIHEDKAGILWLATADGGISRYDYRQPVSKQFRQYKHKESDPHSIPENSILKIVEDSSGDLWLATEGSYAVRFNKQTERFDVPVKSGTRAILSLLIVKDTLLVGRAGGGLMKINTKTLRYVQDSRYDNLYAKLPHASISALFKDARSSIWYGTWDKIVYRQHRNQIQAFVPYASRPQAPGDEVISFAQDKQQRIWMAGKTTGLTIYDPITDRFSNYRHRPFQEGSLADNHLNVIYTDRNGLVWIGSNNGINVYNPLFTPFVTQKLPKGKKDIVIYDFFKDSNRDLWIATSEGIFIQDAIHRSFKYHPVIFKGQHLAVTKFFLDVDGQFYIGTDYTLFRYDLKSHRIVILANTEKDPVMKKLISSRIVSIVRDTVDNHPVLMVSPYGHYLSYYDLVDQKWVSRSDPFKDIVHQFGLRDNLVRKIYKDKSGHTWFANFKAGLGIWQGSSPGAVQYFSNKQNDSASITGNSIFDLQQDPKGNFWISTYGGGLNYFEPVRGRFSHIPESSNLSEGIQLDQSGNLWMLCNGHVHYYNVKQKSYSCYDLPSAQHTTGLRGYIFKDKAQHFYAAGLNFFVTFKPDEIAKLNGKPRIYFTDFKIFGKSFSHLLNRTIKLSYSENFFAFEFSAPEYNGNNLVYSYMLEGVDRSWVEAGKRNFAQYAHLSPGHYRFKVKANNWKDTPSDQYSSIDIVVMPPFWHTWWFIALVSFAILGILYFAYRYRMKELLRRQAIRNGIAQDLHDHIGSTLSSILVYSEVARTYQEKKKPEQLKDVLVNISDTAGEMIGEMSDIVWAINPANDDLAGIVNRINSYAKPLCSAMEINLSVIVSEKMMAMSIEMRARKNIFLIIKEALNNAIKYSHCKQLILDIHREKDAISISIVDDGIGFCSILIDQIASQSLSGNGLHNMRSRAEELGAELKIESHPGKGSSVSLLLAFKNDIMKCIPLNKY